ncbi:recombinase RecT [bacterium]|nr:recombinase RecT [Candidatus Omnitrophota bacterium]MBA3065584.1 recombinase RecT [bacterium]
MAEVKQELTKKDQASALVDWMKPAMATALPRHLNADRMVRIVLTEMRRNPKLVTCTKQSLAGSVIMASQLGLEPGVNGQCWLVPYGNEATFIIGYQGLIELAYRSNMVEFVIGEAVYENDEFTYSLGTEQFIKHVPAEADRGKLKAAYAVAKMKGASMPVFKVLTKEDILKVKASSPAANSAHSPWNTWPETMWVKTAVKKLMKFIPKSAEINKALEADDRVDAGKPQPFSDVIDLPEEKEGKGIEIEDVK